MSKKADFFASNHTAQIAWLDGQIAKNNLGIFINPQLAEKEWNRLKDANMGIIDDQNVEAFMSRYLSEVGDKKLYTTLRVAETRAKKSGFRLQCSIDYSANRQLQVLAARTGLSKGELISKLIEQSGHTLLQCNSSEGKETETIAEVEGKPVQHNEEQLDLDVGGEWHLFTKFSQVKPGIVMRNIDSGLEYVVYERDGKTILFEDGGELDAYQAKKKYEIKIVTV